MPTFVGTNSNDLFDSSTPNWTTYDTIYGLDGNDTIQSSYNVSAYIDGGAGNDVLSGVGTLTGGSGNDTINGLGYLYGGDGNDSITGAGYLDGGTGNDTLTLIGNGTLVGSGADLLIGESGGNFGPSVANVFFLNNIPNYQSRSGGTIMGGSGPKTSNLSYANGVGISINTNGVSDTVYLRANGSG